jgi:hypothetical protein
MRTLASAALNQSTSSVLFGNVATDARKVDTSIIASSRKIDRPAAESVRDPEIKSFGNLHVRNQRCIHVIDLAYRPKEFLIIQYEFFGSRFFCRERYAALHSLNRNDRLPCTLGQLTGKQILVDENILPTIPSIGDVFRKSQGILEHRCPDLVPANFEHLCSQTLVQLDPSLQLLNIHVLQRDVRELLVEGSSYLLGERLQRGLFVLILSECDP